MTVAEIEELMQLRSTEAHLVQLLADADSEEEQELLMAKYRRTQARRMSIEIVEQ